MDVDDIELHHINAPHSMDGPLLHRTDSLTDLTIPEQIKEQDRGSLPPRSRWNTLHGDLKLQAVASLLFFLAIVVVLKVFDKKSLPDLPLNISLNAVVGLLATFGEFLLMVPVASSIGQIKWLRACKKRPMNEFRFLDEASRGPWGGVLLLVHTKGGILALIGALITILALTTSTFVQQALKYDTFYPTAGKALMPFAQYMNITGFANQGGDHGGSSIGIDRDMISALYTGLYSPPNTTFTPTAQCETGNCTWSSYQSLGFCNTCVNISSELNRTKVHVIPPNKYEGPYDTEHYTLPNGFALTGVQPASVSEGSADFPFLGLLNVTTTTSFPFYSSVAFKNNGSVWMTATAIGFSPGSVPSETDTELPDDLLQAPPVAFECALQFCIKNMSATFSSGFLNETISSIWINKTLQTSQYNIAGDQHSIILNPPFEPPRTFVIDNDAFVGTGQWLGSWVSGNVTMIVTPNVHEVDGWQVYSSEIMQSFYQTMNSSTNGFQGAMDNLANSMSLALRNSAYQPDPVQGFAFLTTSYFIVRWAWLALPFAVLLSSSAFLIAVIVEIKKRGLVPWSNNILATLFHGLNEGITNRGWGIQDFQTTMEEDARNYLLEFRSDSEGGHLFASSMR